MGPWERDGAACQCASPPHSSNLLHNQGSLQGPGDIPVPDAPACNLPCSSKADLCKAQKGTSDVRNLFPMGKAWTVRTHADCASLCAAGALGLERGISDSRH